MAAKADFRPRQIRAAFGRRLLRCANLEGAMVHAMLLRPRRSELDLDGGAVEVDDKHRAGTGGIVAAPPPPRPPLWRARPSSRSPPGPVPRR